jgi:hypothetical protein
MPTQRQGYRTADGTKRPSVTTILGRFKESGTLMQWAYRTGREHGRLDAEGKEAPASLYEVSGKAADIGTAAHAMVELHINGVDPENAAAFLSLDDEGRDKARNAFGMYLQWAKQSRLEIVAQEVGMVSERFGFGGTLDAIGKIDGVLCLVDWKTSNGVYSDYLLQLAAYKVLWEENYPDQLLLGGFHLCRFSKEHGDFAHHYYRELDNAWQMFRHLLEAYRFDAELKRRA